MTAPSRLDWQKSSTADAIALARSQVRRADLPADVEAALVDFEMMVEQRKQRPIAYVRAAERLVTAVCLADARGEIAWCRPIQQAIHDLQRGGATRADVNTRSLAGKVWRVYRREGE